uniref:Uncharacterized protein n=1 Tax=Arundo donax TaxID=35708 RepID=A0A0A8ZUR4_ARUDO
MCRLVMRPPCSSSGRLTGYGRAPPLIRAGCGFWCLMVSVGFLQFLVRRASRCAQILRIPTRCTANAVMCLLFKAFLTDAVGIKPLAVICSYIVSRCRIFFADPYF